MCYDVSFTVKINSIAEYFPDLEVEEGVGLNFDAAIHIMGHAYRGHPIIYRNRDTKKLHIKMMEWGVIPFYVKEEAKFIRQRASMLNARSERILDDKTSYWFKIRERRCLIPVTGIYEHREVKGFKTKIPYYVKPKDQEIFYLPGLYSMAELPDLETGELIKRSTFTLITRAANPLMAQIHNGGDNAQRMPLFLTLEQSSQWVNDLDEPTYRNLINTEIPSQALHYHTVFTIRTTKPHPEHKQKNEPYQWDNLAELEVVG
jgi:putative SOS response-associated peptidase YedK